MPLCRIVYKPDDTVAVIHYAPKSRLSYEHAMQKAMDGCNFTGFEFEDTTTDQLPQDRKYRDAWRKRKGQAFTMDQVKVAEVDARPTEEEEKQFQDELRLLAKERIDARSR